MVFSVKIIRNYKINGVKCMSETHKYGGTWRLFEKTNYIKSSEKQNQNSECFEMRDNNCNK